jgi:hypothetical protein
MGFFLLSYLFFINITGYPLHASFVFNNIQGSLV